MATVSYWIVGGGAGSGGRYSGGGGAGGVQGGVTTVSAGEYPVQVGAAGGYGEPALPGGDSSFNGITAIGGGRPAGPYACNAAGVGGGCGGGGSAGFDTSGCSTAGAWTVVAPGSGLQGYDGGAAQALSGGYMGGGGGMGGPGQPGSSSGATGGLPLYSDITGTSRPYAAGGGGGGQVGIGTRPACDYGGGGTANWTFDAQPGVVFIAYATGSLTAMGGTITTSGGQTIHRFTSNGTFSVGQAYGSCAASLEIPSLPYSNTLTGTSGASDPNPDGPCGSGPGWAPIWYRYTALAGQTSLTATIAGTGGIVSVWSGSCGALTHLGCCAASATGTVTVSVLTGVTYYFEVTNATNTARALTFSLSTGTAPTNDTCATATVISTLPYSHSEDNTTAGADSTPDGPCGSGSSYRGVWYTYTAGAGVTRLAVSVQDAATDGVVSAFSGSCGALLAMGCTATGAGELFLTVTPGDPYYFLVTSAANVAGSITISLRDATQPSTGLTILVDCGTTKQWKLHRFDAKPRTEQTA